MEALEREREKQVLERERERERERREDLAFENLRCEELDLEIGGEGDVAIGGEDGGGDVPGRVGLLELNEPLIGCDAVAGLGIVVEHMDGLRHLHCQFHDVLRLLIFVCLEN